MKRSNHTVGRIIFAILFGLGLAVSLSSTGCDDYSGMIQDSYEYQQSVYDWANDQWSDYIRM